MRRNINGWMPIELCLPCDGQRVRFAVAEGCCEDEKDGVFHAARTSDGEVGGWAFVTDGGEPFSDGVVEWRGHSGRAAGPASAPGHGVRAKPEEMRRAAPRRPAGR